MSVNGETTCGSKVIYYTEKQARKAVREHREQWGERRYFYECDYCGFYHLSRRTRKRKEYLIKSIGMKWIQ